MKRAISALFLLAFAGFGQQESPMVHYALLLQDTPLAQKYQLRVALKSTEGQTYLQRIRTAQSSVLAELQRRNITTEGSSQILVNAVFVYTTPEVASQLLKLPGVTHVVRVPRLRRDLDKALGVENVPAAWSLMPGGASNAGAGIKIGIIDTGIDQNHPGFQDPSLLAPPKGFPLGETAYTNNKVIVARSYVALDSYIDPSAPDSETTPDDTSPRDHVGHGTAIAMIAAGVQNTGPQATIQGVAPKAFLGNYKVFGSPGVNDYALFNAVNQALQDAIADGMDVVTLSLSEGDMPLAGPLDVDNTYCGGACDIYATAVESAIQNNVVVVAAAGNDGNIGYLQHTLSTIHTPGTAPDAITVGAVSNAHVHYQAVHVNGPGVPSSLQSIQALYGDGPHLALPAALPIVDVTILGDNGLACSALPAGSLSSKVALVQRGTCYFSDKINNAQAAGALGVIIYQQSGANNIYSSLGAQDTGIPAMMIGYSDGVALKSYVDGNSGVTALFDQAFTPFAATAGIMWPSSSRGPSLGSFANDPYKTHVVKPELVAVGAGIYTAAQTLDPNGDGYNPSGYASVTGTSFAVPMVAGAVALVKQLHPTWSPAKLKSAVVNSATQKNLFDTDGVTVPSVNAAGAGLLSAGDAVNVAATVEPATVSFGAIVTATPGTTSPIALTITNVSSAPANFTLAVQPSNSSAATVSVSPSSLNLAANAQSTVSVSLSGPLPSPGSYEGFILINGPSGTPTLRVPYHYQVGSGSPADMFSILDGSFTGGVGTKQWGLAFRLMDAYGVPVFGPALFSIVSGGGVFSPNLGFLNPETSTAYTYGISSAFVDLGASQGPQIFMASAGGLTAEFDGYTRRFPAIYAQGVTDAASFRNDRGLAPGSYISIFGTDLSDTTQFVSTPYLPVSLSTVSVSFDGGGLSVPGHLHFVSPGQINVQIPWEFEGQSSVNMKVSFSGNISYIQSDVYTLPLAACLPGFFMNSGTVADAIDNNTGAVITTANPATADEYLQLYANGLGPVTGQVTSGDPSPASPLAQTGPVTVTIGGMSAAVYGGTGVLAPGYVGLYQVNVQVPKGLSSGPQPIVISVGGQSSAATVSGSAVILPIK